MKRTLDIALTAFAPVVWGSSYIITTEFLPDGYPVTVSLLRALPAGLLLWCFARQLPQGSWWWKIFILGALNFSIFWWMLFVAAYRLPGGVAATVGAIQPLLVIFLSFIVLKTKLNILSIAASVAGICGVALVVSGPAEALDAIGVFAGLGGALSMALGVVMTRKWQPDVSLLTFTSWQLIAGGVLLIPLAPISEPSLPELTLRNYFGFFYLAIIGAALTYVLWFRGISKLGPNIVSPLGFLSPASAITLGWLFLGEVLTISQVVGLVIVIVSILIATRSP